MLSTYSSSLSCRCAINFRIRLACLERIMLREIWEENKSLTISHQTSETREMYCSLNSDLIYSRWFNRATAVLKLANVKLASCGVFSSTLGPSLETWLPSVSEDNSRMFYAIKDGFRGVQTLVDFWGPHQVASHRRHIFAAHWSCEPRHEVWPSLRCFVAFNRNRIACLGWTSRGRQAE